MSKRSLLSLPWISAGVSPVQLNLYRQQTWLAQFKNNHGPRFDPRGMPHETFWKLDNELFTLHICFLLLRYDWNHRSGNPRTP